MRSDAVQCGKRTADHRLNEKIVFVNTNCGICDKPVQKRTGDYNRDIRQFGQVFCSRQCAMVATGKTIILKCSQCDKSFTRKMSEYKLYNESGKFVFCSRKCQDGNIDYILRAEKHYNYINGESTNNRGVGWRSLRELIRNRDNRTCQKCGITEDELGKKLDVHHIVPYRCFDDYKEANKQENLISYCPVCHHVVEQTLVKGA